MKIIFIILFSLKTYAGIVCPDSPLKVAVHVKAKVTYEKNTNMYEYTYELANDTSSKLPLMIWWLQIDESPLEVKSPQNWKFFRYEEASKDSDAEIPGNMNWGVMGNEEKFLQPGQKLIGFSFKSKYPPGIVKYFVDANANVPTVTNSTGEHPSEAPNCPGFLYDLPLFDTKVNGFTTGPAPTNQISVEMKLKKVKEMHPVKYEESDEADINEFTPKKDNGKIAVILKGTNDFDVNTLKVDSVRIGIGQAPVLASSFFGAKKGEKIRLVFDSTKLGLECDRDRALFLKGKTTNGKDVLGAVSIKTINCGAK